MVNTPSTKRLLIIIGAYPDIGKGILASSCAYLLQQQGIKILPLKFDGYLNYSSGSMNPYHKPMEILYDEEEVFVLKDGFETDADSGYYERFIGQELDGNHNLTNGKLFSRLLSEEKVGNFPPGEILKFAHIDREVVHWLVEESRNVDLLILEIGGTVGDPESVFIYRALNLIKNQEGFKVITILLAPYFEPSQNGCLAKSSRTKLARQAFETAARAGARPDIVGFRCSDSTTIVQGDLDYVAFDCGLRKSDLFVVPDCKPVYELPRVLTEQGLETRLISLLDLAPDLAHTQDRLENYCTVYRALQNSALIKIGIFGKSVSQDSYISLREAVEHAATSMMCRVDIFWIDDLIHRASDLFNILPTFDGLIVGENLYNWQEKIVALNIARIQSIPTLCISFGFDLAVYELARGICGLPDVILEEIQSGVSPFRIKTVPPVLGSRPVTIDEGSLLFQLYGQATIEERHRHQSWLSFQVRPPQARLRSAGG